MDFAPCDMFYVTAGRGTESFAMHEIRSKLSAHIVSQSDEIEPRDGKIFFRFEDKCSFRLEDIFKLKSVERIFVAISNYKNTEFIKGKRLFLNKLMDEVTHEESYAFAQCVLQQLMSLSSSPHAIKRKIISRESEPEGHQAFKKAKLQGNVTDDHHHSQSVSTVCDNVSQQANGHETICHSCDKDSEYCSCLDKSVHKPNTTTVDTNGPVGCDISFRFSIKCSGRIRKWLDIRKLGKDLSWRVSKATGWKVDLKDPKYELCLHISDQYVTIGIPLTRVPLSRRIYLHDPGLRGPIAWIMTSMAKIEMGDTILDPMCGKGTLLLESCSELQEANYMGVDNDPSQLASAIKNTQLAGFKERVHFLQANALCLPFKECAVKAVVCDAPFNQKYFTSLSADRFYFSFLVEMTRVLQLDGTLVLLTSQELSEMVTGMLQDTENDCNCKEESVATESSSLKEDSDRNDSKEESVAAESSSLKEDRKHSKEESVVAESFSFKGDSDRNDSREKSVAAESSSLKEDRKHSKEESVNEDNSGTNESFPKISLELVSRHDVKLGETLATILTLKKIILE